MEEGRGSSPQLDHTTNSPFQDQENKKWLTQASHSALGSGINSKPERDNSEQLSKHPLSVSGAQGCGGLYTADNSI